VSLPVVVFAARALGVDRRDPVGERSGHAGGVTLGLIGDRTGER
jgi:hypothetical protein